MAVPLGVTLALPGGSVAHAADGDTTYRPATGGFVVAGQGYGHGRGMSQWGARGAADSGLSWRQILDFYYPGTARSSIGNGEIRVWLSADTDGNTTVQPRRGLAAAVGNTRRALPTGAGYRAWRAVESKGRVSLQYQDAKGSWRSYAFGSGPSIRFTTSSGVVPVVMPDGSVKEVRGSVSAVADSSAPKRLRTVLNSTMESYLRSVVPAEMPSSWHTQALSAQSVAARTYAASYQRNQRAKGATWDICDTVKCQVFKGVANTTKAGKRTVGENPRTDTAINATSGTVLRTSTASGAPFVHAEFSASNGGYTVAGGPRYQVAKADPYDGRGGNPNNAWQVTITPAAVEKAFPKAGSVRSMQVLGRDGRGALGGRAQQVAITGSKGTVTVTGHQFRMGLKLKSEMFRFVGNTAPTLAAATPPKASAPAPAVRPAPGTGEQRSLISTDKAGKLLIRDPQGGGYGAASQIGRSWHTLDQLMSVGDFDGNGTEDLVARQKGTGRLVLYKGQNRGALRGPKAPLRGPYAISGAVRHLSSFVSVGDFDKDGHNDLAALDNRGRIVLLRGGAGGKIVQQKVIAAPAGAKALLAGGRFDKDGHPDIMWVDRVGRAHVGLGNGAAGFRATVSMGRGWNNFAHVWSPGDMGGDGVDDVLALDRTGTLYRYNGNGRGGLGARTVVAKSLSGVLVAR